MALSYNVQLGGTVNINVRYGADNNGFDLNIFQSDGTTGYDVSQFLNSSFRIYNTEGLPESDTIIEIDQGGGLTLGTSKLTINYPWALMKALQWGYKYHYHIYVEDQNLTNKNMHIVKGDFFVGS